MSGARRAFTLIEVMIVVILLSLLAGFVSTNVVRHLKTSRLRIAEAMVRSTLSQMLHQFYVDNGFYPTTDQGLQALVEKPATGPEPTGYGEEGYADEIPADPWGMPYQYACPGTRNPRRFDLWSAGPDGRSGADDDIGNW